MIKSAALAPLRFHKKPQDLSVKQDLLINEALARLVHTLAARRAFIFQQHNGAHNTITGFSFKNLSMTHEVGAPGVSHSSSNWQGIPLSMFAYWYEHIRSNRELIIPDIEGLRAEDGSGYQVLKDNGIGAMYVVGLFGFEVVEPIAFVGVAFRDPVKLTLEQIASLRAVAMKVCGCLMLEEAV